jgi:hypothetical protein
LSEDLEHRVVVRRSFKHLKVRYLFQWNLQHHREFDQPHSRDLWHALSSVVRGRIPLNAFESENYDRASKLRTPRRSSDDWFVSDLVDRGLLETDACDNSFSSICSSIASMRKVRDRHLQVQEYLLMNDPRMVAMEVPVWSGFLRLTGHVDLIRIDDDCLEVIDYKPEGNFLRSMPQVAAYTYLLDSCYNTLKLEDMKCVSFNEREAWIYSPLVLRELIARLDDGAVVEQILKRFDMIRGR